MVEKSKVKNIEKVSAPVWHGVGRRKTAIARVWFSRGGGDIIVNGKKHTSYFDTIFNSDKAAAPLRVVTLPTTYTVRVNVVGGGLPAQADAISLGIARVLVALDEAARPVLRQHGMLTADSRRKERKKYGQKAARRKFQFVKR